MKTKQYKIKSFFKGSFELPESAIINASNMYDAAVIYIEQNKKHLNAEIDADMDQVIANMRRL